MLPEKSMNIIFLLFLPLVLIQAVVGALSFPTLVGEWISTNYTIPGNISVLDCCMPQGNVTFLADVNGTMVMSSSAWTGDLCDRIGPFLNPYTLDFPANDTFEDIAFTRHLVNNVTTLEMEFWNLNMTDSNISIFFDLELFVLNQDLVWNSCMIRLESSHTNNSIFLVA